MILPSQTIRKYSLSESYDIERRLLRKPLITPFCERGVINGLSYGLGPCGYDVRCNEDVELYPLYMKKVSSIEYFNIHIDLRLRVCNKSTWLRCGLINFGEGEPGWYGHLTLELMLVHHEPVKIKAGTPVCCVEFARLEEPTDQPYTGKYQNSPPRPVDAIFEQGPVR